MTTGGRSATADGTAAREPGKHEAALFERDGSRVVPTDRARGPWRRDALHGGAVAALLAHAVDVPGRTPARLTIDLLGPVPDAPLTLAVTAPEGGKRVVRQEITLLADGAPVARAHCVAVRRSDLDLPEGATDHPDPFAGAPVPDLSTPTPGAREAVGWDCFDSSAIRVHGLASPDVGQGAAGLWVNLLVPVIAGEPTPAIARVAAAADYASTATNMRLDRRRWSFMNTELTLHLSREPAASWVGLVAAGVVQPVGAGLSVATIYDSAGRLGQSAQALVVEARESRP
ncbi:thioesterase family protein [Actinomadura sp. KC345]|uniref:acyl-CoA thioesterase domain-containing protein n=1 Tax=Actinomadura sp. KC345 TaxID=2530371 RepID=UPI00104B990B|nr:acyl-CoA thioesterase domain-containing protein [Actinomadura sp. KC345]TDC58624.1 thioesterase family protein [Actinomadura sp. KC345]